MKLRFVIKYGRLAIIYSYHRFCCFMLHSVFFIDFYIFICRAIGWRLGLQAVTGVVFVTFILGTFYRSASLYHPQRRAILHLKNQNKIKRKMKDKNKSDDRQPFFDFSTLRSKTVRILLMSTGISAFGINTPIFYLAYHAEEEGNYTFYTNENVVKT